MRSFTESPHCRGADSCGALVQRCSVARYGQPCHRGAWRCGGWRRARQVRPLLVHEPDDMRQRRIVAQLAVLVARDVVDLADGGEHLRLLDGVDAEVGFEIEVEIQHVLRIAGLLDHKRQNAFLHRIASAVRPDCGSCCGCSGWTAGLDRRCGLAADCVRSALDCVLQPDQAASRTRTG